MNLEDRIKISKNINNFVSALKILLSIFLIVVVGTWLLQFLEIQSSIPILDNLTDTLSRMSEIFYTPSKDDEENYNALLYMSISIVFFLLIFEVLTDILSDVLKLSERHSEQVLAEENEKINQKIQQNYKQHLATAFKFALIFKININNPLNNTAAFKDEQLEQKIKIEEEKIVKDIFSIITMSIKCPIKSHPDRLILEVANIYDLNKILSFITKLCNIEKYTSKGVGYCMAVTAYAIDEQPTEAIEEAQKLIALNNNKKTLCYQIVCECLKLVKDCAFNFQNAGQYSPDEQTTIFEIVNKN